MKKIRVAMLVNSNIFAGLEKVATQIMLSLKDEFEFVYVTKPGPVVERLQEYGLEYYLVKKVNKRNIRAFIASWKPDIIHAHDYRASTVSCMTGFAPVICHLHNNPPWIKHINAKSFAYLYFGRKADRLLIVSDSVEKEFVFRQFIGNKYQKIGNPVSYTDVVSGVSEEKEIRYDVCSVGRITEQKNPTRFLNIIKKLKDFKPDIRACWIGDGELRKDLESQIDAYGLNNNVYLTGYLKNPFEMMNKARVFTLTSDYEGYGLVAYEALCLGLPCVVSHVGGLGDIVDASCGWLCDQEDQFVEKIRLLLADPEVYAKYSEGAVHRAKQLDQKDSYMSRFRKLYPELAEKE